MKYLRAVDLDTPEEDASLGLIPAVLCCMLLAHFKTLGTSCSKVGWSYPVDKLLQPLDKWGQLTIIIEEG